MNLRNILSAIFPEQPTLDEYVNAHKPATIADVEFLERQYSEIYSTRAPQIHNSAPVSWTEP